MTGVTPLPSSGVPASGEPSPSPPPFRFSWIELSGSFGDLGLFLPLVVGMAVACKLDIGVILVAAGLMNIATGLLFRQPIPVQPMKAIAAVAITEGLSRGEVAAAGILMGTMILLVSPWADRFSRIVPRSIVRGIQLGVGLKLASSGASDLARLPLWGWDGIAVAAVASALVLFFLSLRKPALLAAFLAGLILLYLKDPAIYSGLHFALPLPAFTWPEGNAWSGGFFKVALPQLPLTMLNSVVAVCALSKQYYPAHGIEPRRMALSVGLMNLLTVPFGAIPMCHGAGGLAAQYGFGARSGGSVIMLGAIKVAAGLLFGGALVGVLGAYPMAIFGPMLIFAGVELGRSARDSFSQPEDIAIVLTTAGFILGANTLVGFLAGCALAAGYRLQRSPN